MSEIEERNESLMQLSVDMVAAYVANNAVPMASLPSLIAEIHASFSRLENVTAVFAEELLRPAVPVGKSITHDYIICLEDGKRFKSLKRHLNVHFGLTPEEYRTKWGLPADYPMVAPNYAIARSDLAKAMGLGRKSTDKPARGKRAA